MPGGKRGHKLREFMRRADAVLEVERGRKAPPPLPISEEHRALREQIADAYSALPDPEEPESTDVVKRVMDDPELASAAVRVLGLMLQEQDLLIRNGLA